MRQTLPIKTERCENSAQFSPFTDKQVINKLVKLKLNNSCGPDGIHVNVLNTVCQLNYQVSKYLISTLVARVINRPT